MGAHSHGSAKSCGHTVMGAHSHGSAKSWEHTVMGAHSHGSAQSWERTVMGAHSHGSTQSSERTVKRGDQKHSNDGHPRRRPKPPRRRPSSSENPTDHQFHFTSERASAFAPPAHHTGELGQQDPQPRIAHETVFHSTSRTSAALRRVHATPPCAACHTTLDFTPLHERACRRLVGESKQLCFTHVEQFADNEKVAFWYK